MLNTPALLDARSNVCPVPFVQPMLRFAPPELAVTKLYVPPVAVKFPSESILARLDPLPVRQLVSSFVPLPVAVSVGLMSRTVRPAVDD